MLKQYPTSSVMFFQGFVCVVLCFAFLFVCVKLEGQITNHLRVGFLRKWYNEDREQGEWCSSPLLSSRMRGLYWCGWLMLLVLKKLLQGRPLISHIWVPTYGDLVTYGFCSEGISYSSISSSLMIFFVCLFIVCTYSGIMMMRNKMEMVWALMEFITYWERITYDSHTNKNVLQIEINPGVIGIQSCKNM